MNGKEHPWPKRPIRTTRRTTPKPKTATIPTPAASAPPSPPKAR
ncbi:putative serine-threonine protein kinase [Bifidobacterium adolescentis ATCC 15703]|uniref:Serine-threonine protein kinase n=1 Tax=Bifidobacterium adolescentis (strain ATCC 15703 / DSM 20083 / NCTC 11814 / E194a) TaxID=367928 RepID=A0ZZX1_BIFAA|nr:putative serine-threonine protein kinase [Bifidobacterium adolescentis ATCC 15703]